MRHHVQGRKLGTYSSHRAAIIRDIALALIERETIRTTTARAKEVRPLADRLVTLAKRGNLAGRRRIIQLLGSTQNTTPGHNRVRSALENLYGELVPRFKDRQGGYTRIIRLRRRAGDDADFCVFQYLPSEDPKKAAKDKGGKKPAGKAAKGTDDKPAKAKAAVKASSKGAAKEPEDQPAKAKKAAKAEGPQDQPHKPKKG